MRVRRPSAAGAAARELLEHGGCCDAEPSRGRYPTPPTRRQRSLGCAPMRFTFRSMTRPTSTRCSRGGTSRRTTGLRPLDDRSDGGLPRRDRRTPPGSPRVDADTERSWASSTAGSTGPSARWRSGSACGPTTPAAGSGRRSWRRSSTSIREHGPGSRSRSTSSHGTSARSAAYERAGFVPRRGARARRSRTGRRRHLRPDGAGRCVWRVGAACRRRYSARQLERAAQLAGEPVHQLVAVGGSTTSATA